MKNKIKKLHSQLITQYDRHQTKIRFISVGVWNTLFGYLAFFFLETIFSHHMGAGARTYMSAILISNIAALLMAYSLHRSFTFRTNSKGKSLFKEFGRFFLSNSLAVALTVGLLPFFVELLGFTPKWGGLFVTGISAIVSYYAHSRITFCKKYYDDI